MADRSARRETGPPASSDAVLGARASVVLREVRAYPELVERVEDIARLPRLTGWAPEILADAIDLLVGGGVFAEAADGRLCIHRRPT
jgi:hypothetical protein